MSDSIADRLMAFMRRPSGPLVPMSSGGVPMGYAVDPKIQAPPMRLGPKYDDWMPRAVLSPEVDPSMYRRDGSLKGPGFLGKLPFHDGSESTELSIPGLPRQGEKPFEIPTLVPTLDKEEIAHLLRGARPTEAIIRKADEHAAMRKARGLSPFADEFGR